jgi:3-deoxy-D-manno-octulosonate 8-phosphate phosphatase (KDO 8-P phosphatase)
MGINLLRFSYWLGHKQIPYTAIISGERNSASFHLASREHFQSAYYKISNKTEALEHVCHTQGLKPEEIAFVFDDILDISMARKCGLRILVNRPGASLFHRYIIQNKLADYMTGSFSGHCAVRESCELIMGFRNNFDQALEERSAFSAEYRKYLEARNDTPTRFFTRKDQHIVEERP